MKKYLVFLCLIAALVIDVNAQDGIKFEKTAWKNILAKAKSQKKLIFMDAYTTWCGPCKMMSNTVFKDKKIGSYFNSNFVNAKIDMEAGEGIMIGSKYPVRGYPTLFFIDPNTEQIVNQALGYQNVEQLLFLAEKVKYVKK